MKTATDAMHAVEFLRWLFGDDPNGYIYVLRSRPSSDPVEARQGKSDLNPATFSTPEKVNSHWWEEQGHLWTMMFSTATVNDRGLRNKGANTLTIPALWCDIDGCKQVGIPADEFYTDIRNSEENSAWIRSSDRGLQLYFKLNEPYIADGDKEKFAEELAGVLYDMALYYGGDCNVVRLGGLMRLPGSLNIKREYKGNYFQAKALTTNDRTFSLQELKERFRPNPDIVPRVVGYACTRALTNIWQEGERHEIMLRFIGSIRKNGINKEACKCLCREVQKFFHDEDRTGDVDSTYENDFSTVMTLHTDYRSIAEDIDKAITFWTELKKVYCKKRDFDFFPENVDPTQPVADDADFFERGMETWFHGREHDEIFCNFAIRLRGRIIKADTGASAWLADIHTAGEPPTRIEISTADHSQWQRFLVKDGMPVGVTVQEPKLWSRYIAYLHNNCPDMVIKETPHYGWLGLEKNHPTLVLPKIEHDEYIWTGQEDTAASSSIFTQELQREDIKQYLQTFIDYYAEYHEGKYIWPALGWFASCSVKGLIHPQLDGFPILVVNGLHGSGKSYLIEEILAMHYGSQAVMGFLGSTNYAFRTKMSANNVCPLIVGEFRTEAKNDRDRGKVNELVDLIRASYDHYAISRGQSSSKNLINIVLEAPWCLVGEHQFRDSAAIERSIILTFDRKRVNEFKAMCSQDRKEVERKHRWLQNYDHRGWLGTILLQWAGKHALDVQKIVGRAKVLVDETCPSNLERKRKGCTAIVVGLSMLTRIYKELDLDFPLSTAEMLEILYAADATVQADHDHDTTTLRYLFEVTDSVIVDAHRTGHPHEGSLYVYDLDDEQFIYVDVTRWFRMIRPLISSADAATLTDKSAFISLIKNHQQQGDSPFVEFLENHPVLGNCVKLDLERVKAFGVNVTQWKGINGYQDI
jgi:hypothetical protein